MAENETTTTADSAKASAAATAEPAARPKIDHQLLEDVIDAIRPSFQADGGDLELIGVNDETGEVTIEMTGACAACMFATADISEGIDGIIKEHVPGVTAVRPVMY
ncbi:NifU family protein [Olsenella uli]|uniref:NifU family protein n=1 Tax=Olsenella uli TaxID=133926 RepID=UPI0012ABC82E|nr:NifU family protein [Olsenella uli]